MKRLFLLTTALATISGASAQTPPTQTVPIPDAPATVGTQGTAGGATTGNPNQLVPVPTVETAALADVRSEQAQTAAILSLEGAVLEALRNNPTPQQQRAAAQAAASRAGIAASAGKIQGNLSGQIGTSRSFGNPSFSTGTDTGTGTGTGTGNNNGGTTGNGSNSGFNNSQQLSLNVSLPIYSGGRVRNSRKAAQASARAALASAQQSEQEIAAQTILAYLSILQNQELLSVAQSNLETSTERRRIAAVRFNAGAAARLEVLRADSDLASAQQRRIAAANNAIQSKSALNILLARPPETPFRVEPITTLILPAVARFPLAEQATAIAGGATAPSSAELRAVADTSLPSLAATRENIVAAGFNVESQRAQRRPNLGLSLTGLLRNPAETIARLALSAGVSIAQNLFDGGRISSQVSEARANLDSARLGLTGQQLQVANAIEGSLLTLDSARKQLGPADVSVLAAQEALRAAQLSYSTGVGTQLEVTDAQNALVSAQTDAVNARYALAQAQVQLAAATAVTSTGSATGRSGLGTSAGTGQNSTVSSSAGTGNTGTNLTGSNSTLGTGSGATNSGVGSTGFNLNN